MKVLNYNIDIKIDKYVIYLVFFFLFFFPRDRFVLYEPYLLWQKDKQNNEQCLDKFYEKKLGRLKKNYFLENDTIIFFQVKEKNDIQYKIPPGYMPSCGTGNKGIILYSNNSDKIKYFEKTRGHVWEFNTYAYPFLTENQNLILLITGENGGYGTLDIKGTEICPPVSSGLYLTSFTVSSDTNLILMGYANGYIKLFNEKLKELWSKKFQDSSISIVKKVALSANGNYCAVLAGLKKEYLYIINKYGRVLLKNMTGEERRRTIDLIFSRDEQYLIEESTTGFRVYSVDNKDLVLDKYLFVPSAQRKIISMDISHDGKFIIVAHKIREDLAMINIFDNQGVLYFRDIYEEDTLIVNFSFNNYNFLIENKNNIYLYNL